MAGSGTTRGGSRPTAPDEVVGGADGAESEADSPGGSDAAGHPDPEGDTADTPDRADPEGDLFLRRST